jgi:hypothetical protein
MGEDCLDIGVRSEIAHDRRCGGVVYSLKRRDRLFRQIIDAGDQGLSAIGEFAVAPDLDRERRAGSDQQSNSLASL